MESNVKWIKLFGYAIAHNLDTGDWFFLKKIGKSFTLKVKTSEGKNIYRSFRNLKDATNYITGKI